MSEQFSHWLMLACIIMMFVGLLVMRKLSLTDDDTATKSEVNLVSLLYGLLLSCLLILGLGPMMKRVPPLEYADTWPVIVTCVVCTTLYTWYAVRTRFIRHWGYAS